MKKVRVALAATAIPTAGMLAMPTTLARAADVPAHQTVPANVPVTAVTAAADAPCIYSWSSVSASGNGEFLFYANGSYSPPGCVIFQQGTLTHRQTGLTERVRFYNAAGDRIAQYKRGGTILIDSTFWWSSPYQGDTVYAWGALVKNGTSDVQYGPVPLATLFL
jgi:hypothetical protein